MLRFLFYWMVKHFQCLTVYNVGKSPLLSSHRVLIDFFKYSPASRGLRRGKMQQKEEPGKSIAHNTATPDALK